MKKAFTLIELLVVIAIIAILAAILFPVFAQAKAAAKNIAALSNTKQMGTSYIMYTNDYDDLFPLAGVLRPNGGLLGMGLAYPVPAGNGELVSNGGNSVWQTPARIAMANCFAANSVQPYAKSYDLGSFSGNKNISLSSRVFPTSGFVAPKYYTLTYNGDLHRLSTTAVAAPSAAVMLWPGQGNSNILGLAVCQPSLNCSGTVDDCMFNSGAAPSATPGYALSNGGDIGYYPLDVTTNLSFGSTKKGPMVRTDTSAKANPMGTATFPTYVSAAGAFVDPYNTIVPSNDAFGNWACSDGQTPVTGDLTNTYMCFFRPDRVK